MNFLEIFIYMFFLSLELHLLFKSTYFYFFPSHYIRQRLCSLASNIPVNLPHKDICNIHKVWDNMLLGIVGTVVIL